MNKLLFKHSYVIMSATVVGYFYNLGKRYSKCRHTGCGFEPLENHGCWYARYNDPKDKEHKKCQDDWCHSQHGPRPNPMPVAKSVKCKRTYFKPYTTLELANPATKVELVAIEVDLAQYYQSPSTDCVAIYNLMEDKWASNDWWSLTPGGDISPSRHHYLSVKPSSVVDIDAIIAKVKEGI